MRIEPITSYLMFKATGTTHSPRNPLEVELKEASWKFLYAGPMDCTTSRKE